MLNPSFLFILSLGVLGTVQSLHSQEYNPVPPDAGVIYDNYDNMWYAEPGMYYDYLVLYSDTTEDAIQRVVNVYGLHVKRKPFSKKRQIKFYIDDNDFSGYVYEYTIPSFEYHVLFPQQ